MQANALEEMRRLITYLNQNTAALPPSSTTPMPGSYDASFGPYAAASGAGAIAAASRNRRNTNAADKCSLFPQPPISPGLRIPDKV